MKSIEQYILDSAFIILYRAALPFDSVNLLEMLN